MLAINLKLKPALIAIAVLTIVPAIPGQKIEGSFETKRKSEKAYVYFYALEHAKTLGKVTSEIYLSGRELARLPKERYFIVELEPGVHSFHLKNKKRGGLELNLAAGETAYVQMKWYESVTVGAAGLSIVPKANADFDLKQFKPIDKRDLKAHDLVFLKLVD